MSKDDLSEVNSHVPHQSQSFFVELSHATLTSFWYFNCTPLTLLKSTLKSLCPHSTDHDHFQIQEGISHITLISFSMSRLISHLVSHYGKIFSLSNGFHNRSWFSSYISTMCFKLMSNLYREEWDKNHTFVSGDLICLTDTDWYRRVHSTSGLTWPSSTRLSRWEFSNRMR